MYYTFLILLTLFTWHVATDKHMHTNIVGKREWILKGFNFTKAVMDDDGSTGPIKPSQVSWNYDDAY